MPEPRTIRAVTIGHGGITLHTGRHSYTTGLSETELPGRLARALAGEPAYPTSPHLGTEDLAPGCLIIDCRPIPWDDLTRYSIRGPMIDAALAPGTVDPLDGPAGPWTDDGTDFGARPDGTPVGGFDSVAPDVQAHICRRFGGTIHDARAYVDAHPTTELAL